MKNFILVIVVLIGAMATFGYARGWYDVGGEKTKQPTQDEYNMKVKVNKDKIDKDVEKAKEAVKDAGEAVKDAGEAVKDAAKKQMDKVKGTDDTSEPDTNPEPEKKSDENPDAK